MSDRKLFSTDVSTDGLNRQLVPVQIGCGQMTANDGNCPLVPEQSGSESMLMILPPAENPIREYYTYNYQENIIRPPDQLLGSDNKYQGNSSLSPVTATTEDLMQLINNHKFEELVEGVFVEDNLLESKN